MSVETLLTEVEGGLLRIIRLALGWRHPAVANLAALAARSVAELPDLALVYVTASGTCFEWDAASQAAANGTTIIASTTLAPSARGRWLQVNTALTYGAGGTNLGKKQSGYLRTVESYACDDGPEAAIERVNSSYPSTLVQFTGDEVESLSNIPGALYRCVLNFKLLIFSQNLRPSPSATMGPRDPTEAADDPGVYRIIGDLRRVLHGVAFDNGIADVERIAVGGSELGFEDLDRRVYVWLLDLKVRASYQITDEDLVDATIRAQPELTECWPAPKWDRTNYIALGGGLDEGKGPGLARTIDQTVAVVQSSAVSVAPQAVTLAAGSDTYRDLDPAGTWTLTAVPSGSSPPPVATGRLRVAVTTTDGSSVMSDRALCSFSIPYGDPIDLP